MLRCYKAIAIIILLTFTSFKPHGDIKFMIESALVTESALLLSKTTEDTLIYTDGNIKLEVSRLEFLRVIDSFFFENPYKTINLLINQNSNFTKRELMWLYQSKNGRQFRLLFYTVFDEKEAHYHLKELIVEEQL